MAEILTLEGHRAPPVSFVKKLERFDSNLRVVWGLGQAVPFPGWVIERRIPGHMKERVYRKTRPQDARFADQAIVDSKGNALGRRRFDMLPDWHPVYQVMDGDGLPIVELGDFVIDYLRQPNIYRRTLLGFSELSLKFLKEDHDANEERKEKRHGSFIDQAVESVMSHKTEVFPESFAFGGQPSKVHEGTEI